MEKNIGKWFDEHRFFIFVIVMLIIWGSIILFLWMKADEITKDPCNICAEKHGEDVYCTRAGEKDIIPITKVYHPDGSSETIKPELT